MFAAEAAIDWHQSLDIVATCNEINPIIGECGQRVPLAVYLPAVVLGEVLIAYSLPPKWRKLFEGFALGLETHTIWSNYENGY